MHAVCKTFVPSVQPLLAHSAGHFFSRLMQLRWDVRGSFALGLKPEGRWLVFGVACSNKPCIVGAMSQPVALSASWQKVLGVLSNLLVHERMLAGAAPDRERFKPQKPPLQPWFKRGRARRCGARMRIPVARPKAYKGFL